MWDHSEPGLTAFVAFRPYSTTQYVTSFLFPFKQYCFLFLQGIVTEQKVAEERSRSSNHSDLIGDLYEFQKLFLKPLFVIFY